MKINVTFIPKDFDGKEFTDKGEPAKLRLFLVNALMGSYPDELSLSGEEKYKRFKIADRISCEDEPELSAEEITLIKKLVGKGFPPLIVGRVYDVIDPRKD